MPEARVAARLNSQEISFLRTRFPPQHATNEFPRRPPTAHDWPRLLLLLLLLPLLPITVGAHHNIPSWTACTSLWYCSPPSTSFLTYVDFFWTAYFHITAAPGRLIHNSALRGYTSPPTCSRVGEVSWLYTFDCYLRSHSLFLSSSFSSHFVPGSFEDLRGLSSG